MWDKVVGEKLDWLLWGIRSHNVSHAKESGLYRMSYREPVIMFKGGSGQGQHSVI